jgi:hypothetical protein
MRPVRVCVCVCVCWRSDWQFSPSGEIVARRSLECREQRLPGGDDDNDDVGRASAPGLRARPNRSASVDAAVRTGYPMVGEAYQLGEPSPRAKGGGLRVTFVTVTTSLSMVNALRALAAHHGRPRGGGVGGMERVQPASL